jgi:hypothetical protein
MMSTPTMSTRPSRFLGTSEVALGHDAVRAAAAKCRCRPGGPGSAGRPGSVRGSTRTLGTGAIDAEAPRYGRAVP